jgi:hypothetical protein
MPLVDLHLGRGQGFLLEQDAPGYLLVTEVVEQSPETQDTQLFVTQPQFAVGIRS